MQEKKFYRPRAASLCDYASDEEVDDDELGSEIDGTRQTSQQQAGIQPQQQMFMQQ